MENIQIPKQCKTCTQFLNNKLPFENCYTYCPKYDRTPIKVSSPTELLICPKCNEKSLTWNEKTLLFECLNLKCGISYTEPDLRFKYWEIKAPKVNFRWMSGYMDDGGWVGSGRR
jgi:hypothetical protein